MAEWQLYSSHQTAVITSVDTSAAQIHRAAKNFHSSTSLQGNNGAMGQALDCDKFTDHITTEAGQRSGSPA